MYNTIIYAIVVVMLASTVVVAKPRNNQTNGQTREQYCRQLVGPEKGEGEVRQNRDHAIADNAVG